MKIEDIQLGATRLINDLIRKEFQAQGHTLTGAFEASLSPSTRKIGRTTTTKVEGLKYGMTLNDGLNPSQISNRMYPGLMEYFIKRGLKTSQAARAAAATIKKWKSEGMSTQASRRFSKTGGRQHFIEAAFIGSENIIDNYMEQLFDYGIDEEFKKTKNERI